MSGKEAGHHGYTKGIHRAGERVWGKSQGSWAGSDEDLQPWGFFWRGKAGPHILGPSPDRSRAVGSAPAPGIGHWAGTGLSWDVGSQAELWAKGAQSCYRVALPWTGVSGSEINPSRGWAGTSGLLMPSRLGQDGPVENLTLLDISSESFSLRNNQVIRKFGSLSFIYCR